MKSLVVPSAQDYYSVFPFLYNMAASIASTSTDYVFDDIKSAQLFMHEVNKIRFRCDRTDDFVLDDFAKVQLCNRIGMPIQYFNKLASSHISDERSLACTNINVLSSICNKTAMIRTTGNTVRGLLSKKYTKFDVNEMLDVFSNVMDYTDNALCPSDIQFRGSYIALDRFHMRFTTSAPLTGVPDNDLYAGVQIDSSDVGKARLSVRFFIYKQVCTNGLCIAKYDTDMFIQRHINVTKDDFADGLRRSLAVFPTLTERAKMLLTEAGSVNLADSPIYRLEENEPVRKALQQYFRITEEELMDVADIAKVLYPRTLWGFTNSVTHKANEFSFERRATTELLAGSFLYDYRRLHVA